MSAEEKYSALMWWKRTRFSISTPRFLPVFISQPKKNAKFASPLKFQHRSAIRFELNIARDRKSPLTTISKAKRYGMRHAIALPLDRWRQRYAPHEKKKDKKTRKRGNREENEIRKEKKKKREKERERKKKSNGKENEIREELTTF